MKRSLAAVLALAALPATASAVLPTGGGTIDLATTYDARISGDADLRGNVAAIGDFTGDGTGDVAVVTKNPDGVRILHGGTLSGDQTFNGVPAATLASASRLITTVAGAGDVNGDGLQDLVVGSCDLLAAADGDATAGGDGRAWVVFGRAGTGAIDLDAASFGGFAITGSGGECLGRAVAGAGDANGDGRADVVVGANTHGGTKGRAVVVFGKPDEAGVATASLGAAGFDAVGPAGANAGAYVAGVGDVNGDGRADVGVGGRNYDGPPAMVDSGAIWIVHGGDAATLELESLAGRGFRIDGVDESFLGAVAPAGDVNKDGKADIAWGAPGSSVGSAGVVFGRSETTATSVTTGGYRFTSSAAEKLGFDVRGGADLNGDGTPDIVAGAPDAADRKGKAYILYGRPAGGDVSVDSLGAGGVTILGPRFEDEGQSGTQIGFEGWIGLGDVDCDGAADVLLASARGAVLGGGVDPGTLWVNRGPGGACAGAGGGSGGGTTPPPATTPAGGDGKVVQILSAKLKNRRLRVGRRPTAITGARRAPAGTFVRFALSEPATVSFRVTCQRPKKKQKAFCKKLLKRNTLTRAIRTAGTTTFAFSGRIGKRKLALGRYRMTLVATDADGSSAPRALRFRVVRR